MFPPPSFPPPCITQGMPLMGTYGNRFPDSCPMIAGSRDCSVLTVSLLHRPLPSTFFTLTDQTTLASRILALLANIPLTYGAERILSSNRFQYFQNIKANIGLNQRSTHPPREGTRPHRGHPSPICCTNSGLTNENIG